MSPKKTKTKPTPCETCIERHCYCGLSGKDIADKTTDEFEDANAYCKNHAKIRGLQRPG